MPTRRDNPGYDFLLTMPDGATADLSLNVIEHVDLVSDPLDNPDGHCIGLRTGTADVEEGTNG